MNTPRTILRTSIAIISITTFHGWTFAQQSSAPAQTASPARNIRLSLIVTDQSNHSRDDVNKDEVQVLEDRVPQPISFFANDDRPVNYAVAIDTSGSFKNLLNPTLDALKLLINRNRELDETMLISFVSSDKIETIQNFTADKSKLVESLKLFRIEGGQSAVIDAIYLAVQAAAAYKAGDSSIRRAVVLISDGEDRASYYTTDALIKLMRAKDVQVFIIGVVTQLDNSSGSIRSSPREAAEKLLSRVALETGGRVFFPKNISQLTQAVGEILHDLHAQYTIGYEPKNNANENFRKIEAKIIETVGREKLIGIMRSGYFINPPDLDGKEKKKKSK